MLQKIAKIITNNFGLKVLSVVIAVVFWLVIVNVEDPERTKVFSVPVVIENENYLRNMGKTYEILDKTDTITFTVTAKRSVIERVSASDFAVTANMQDIIDMSKIPVTVVAQKYANQLTVTKRSQYVEVFVAVSYTHLAVKAAVRNGLLVITGGPGTGKTTTINTIIRYFEAEGMDIFLAAPTGRAAKRMSETTGFEARTIHRMLEINGGIEESAGFERNERNPLETDVVIIDEMSMVDITLMLSLIHI